jgi:hypothetical protein
MPFVSQKLEQAVAGASVQWISMLPNGCWTRMMSENNFLMLARIVGTEVDMHPPVTGPKAHYPSVSCVN